MSEENKYAGSFVDEEELGKDVKVKEAEKKGKQVLEEEESTLFKILRGITEAVTESKQGAVYQLEGIKAELNKLNTNFDAFFEFLARQIEKQPSETATKSKQLQEELRKPPAQVSPVNEIKKLIPPELLKSLKVIDAGDTVVINVTTFLGGGKFGEVMEIVRSRNGGWVPKTATEKGYFSIAKRDI